MYRRGADTGALCFVLSVVFIQCTFPNVVIKIVPVDEENCEPCQPAKLKHIGSSLFCLSLSFHVSP